MGEGPDRSHCSTESTRTLELDTPGFFVSSAKATRAGQRLTDKRADRIHESRGDNAVAKTPGQDTILSYGKPRKWHHIEAHH
jgi:hypothetical protein